jgi:hypothetical protein
MLVTGGEEKVHIRIPGVGWSPISILYFNFILISNASLVIVAVKYCASMQR